MLKCLAQSNYKRYKINGKLMLDVTVIYENVQHTQC